MKYTVFVTAWGWMGVAASARGLRRVVLPRPSREEVLARLGGVGEAAPPAFGDLPQRLQGCLHGERVAFPEALDLEGYTPFQRRVWQAVQAIPPGETRSYTEVARAAGSPGAARAVGQAMAANPLPLIIPCHRVVARHGLGGFGGGLALKQALLQAERQLNPFKAGRRAEGSRHHQQHPYYEGNSASISTPPSPTTPARRWWSCGE